MSPLSALFAGDCETLEPAYNQEFQAEKPIEIAKQYAAYTGINFNEEMAEMFNEVQNLVINDSRNEN